MANNIRIRFVTETGEEGKAADKNELAARGDGSVIETWTEDGDLERPDLRAEFVPDWISVEETYALHEACGRRAIVRMIGTLGEPIVSTATPLFSLEDGTVSWWDDDLAGQLVGVTVTHWMPLPSTEVGK